MPKEETFPIPLKYIDVTRSTHTDLDVMQEKRIDDYWNVDTNNLSVVGQCLWRNGLITQTAHVMSMALQTRCRGETELRNAVKSDRGAENETVLGQDNGERDEEHEVSARGRTQAGSTDRTDGRRR